MKIKLSEIVGIHLACKNDTLGAMEGVYWGMFLAENELATADKFNAYVKTEQTSLGPFYKERTAYLETFTADENGLYHLEGDDLAGLNKIVENHKHVLEEVEALLNEEHEIELSTIHLSQLPSELKRDQIRPIARLIRKE